MAPKSPSLWDGRDSSQWLGFKDVNGLKVDGFGTIDGGGKAWWDQSCRYHPQLVHIYLINYLASPTQARAPVYTCVYTSMSIHIYIYTHGYATKTCFFHFMTYYTCRLILLVFNLNFICLFILATFRQNARNWRPL